MPANVQRLLDSLSTAVLTFDQALRLTTINPAGEMLFEISAKKVLGQHLIDLLPTNPGLVRILQSTLKQRRAFTARSVALRLPWRRALTIDCTVTALTDGTEGLLVEITQVDRWQRLAREGDQHERQAANRAVMRGLAHEIKNPLGGLRGAAQLLDRELKDPSLRDYTRIIIHEADRLRDLVDRMIGPSRPLALHPLNVHTILEHVRKLLEAENPVGLRIVREYDPSLPDVIADSGQLVQAVLNIVRNAVQATDGRGQITLRTRIERGLTIGRERHRLAARVDIEDNGPGIPAGLREKIFYPMVTGRPEGTGLGLSIAQEIVLRHDGLLEVASEPGRTVFSIFIPLRNDHEQHG
jgi:two-component system nitrogen regulation sensor histidine kinase GlnL